MAKIENDREALGHAIRAFNEQRSGVVLTGEIIEGKVVLDEAALRAIKEKFADAKVSFVAVNAPFDPDVHAAD
ncbi:hypothetical protein FMN50_13695 [Rhodobacterales bacterium]|nr:hypothetical protein FMN50_13695 [Rhodobacterales bacterium]